MPKFLGFQIANADGVNVQGDDVDPTGFPSFYILNPTEALLAMAKFGKRDGLLLQPIFEGDIEEPEFAASPVPPALWPADDLAVINCDPHTVVEIAIKSAADNAPYNDPDRDIDNPDWEPEASDIAFWDRVKSNADRIATWALSGLSITQRARLGSSQESASQEEAKA